MSIHPFPTRILVCDSNPLLAEAICAQLERHGGFAAWAGGLDVDTQQPGLRPNVVVLDPAHGGDTPAGWRERLHRLWPSCEVVAYVNAGDRRSAGACLAAGFAGAVSQGKGIEALIDALNAIQAGGVYVDDDLAPLGGDAGASPWGRANGPQAPAALSERERSVLESVARGFSNKEIAGQLGLSAKTVETYRARGAGKLGLRRKSEIVRFALRHDWLAEPIAAE